VQDIPVALAMLAAETNLTFTETTDATAADLTFAWKETGAAGLGGGGKVWFDIDHRWVMDDWPGFGAVTTPDGWRGYGHGVLVLHETMHAMGFGHVDDRASIMGSAATIGPGDLDGLHTMYRDVPCPVG
ncbi:MAG: ZnMc protein, partial [Actinomycetota bacterium]|nr:ZnMc protein [Actinomycetota bacterium]